MSTFNAGPSLEEVIELVREFTWARYEITAETRIEEDLRVVGDDGVELLEAAEKRFNVDLTSPEHGIRKTLGLGPNEYLFEAEGGGLVDFVGLIRRLRGKAEPEIRDLTVAELRDAIANAPQSAGRPEEAP